VPVDFLILLLTDVLDKLKKGGLGLGSYESKLFGLGVDVFKDSQVDHDGLVEQALQLRREDHAEVVLVDREIVGMFAIYKLGLIGVGDILFLGLILLLIECVHVDLSGCASGVQPCVSSLETVVNLNTIICHPKAPHPSAKDVVRGGTIASITVARVSRTTHIS